MKKKIKVVFWILVVLGTLILADHVGSKPYQKHLDDLDARQSAHQADLASHPQDPDPRRR